MQASSLSAACVTQPHTYAFAFGGAALLEVGYITLAVSGECILV